MRTQEWKSETRKSLWPEIRTPGEMGNWQENQLIVLRFGLIWGVAGTQHQCLSRDGPLTTMGSIQNEDLTVGK